MRAVLWICTLGVLLLLHVATAKPQGFVFDYVDDEDSSDDFNNNRPVVNRPDNNRPDITRPDNSRPNGNNNRPNGNNNRPNGNNNRPNGNTNRPNRPNRPNSQNRPNRPSFDYDYVNGDGGDDYTSFIPNWQNRPNGNGNNGFNNNNNGFSNNNNGFNNNNNGFNNNNRPTRPPVVITSTSAPAPPPTRASNCEAQCLTTNQWNPVCGTDNVTYNNMGRLECAQRCGKRVAFRVYGRCTPLLPGLQQIERWR